MRWYSDLRLRIVDRYLLRELGSNFLAATFILLLIVVGTAVADLLAKIARGRIPADLLFTLIALRSVDALTVLMPLAARMMESELQEISLAEALDVIRTPLNRVGVFGMEAERFLSSMQDSSGLVLERESGRWSFAHLTFQEYLTSAWWSSGKAAPGTGRAVCARPESVRSARSKPMMKRSIMREC